MTQNITDKIYYVGVKNPDLKVFDVIMHTKYGTSYNAYVVKGNNKVALIEMVKNGFSKEHRDMVAQIVPLESIDYIVMSHTEPDHSGSLEEFLSINPKATVVATRSAHNFLAEIGNKGLYCNLSCSQSGENHTFYYQWIKPSTSFQSHLWTCLPHCL